MRLSYLFIFLAIFYCRNAYSQIKNEDDLKKQAEQYFENEDYNLAYKLFAQLVSLYPKDPDYNYKLGVCMLYTEPDKKKPYSYLQLATKNPADAPKDALFYLAKTYHINYRFDEAIKLYTEYKKIGSSASIKKLQVDREIQACKNGKRLLSNLSDLVVITKKQLNEADYFKGYDVKDIGGKLLVKPDEYKSGYDKKKKDKSVVYLPRSGERLYYSSYGENGNTGRDIYYVNRLPNGSWSKATMLPLSINTEFDEDYPFLHPNGKTLYFSSKGHNSMGGYDVFKTTYDDATKTWSKPENLEFPINSPDDDILFVTDSLEKMAFFSTGRYSPYGKLDVLKISTERRPMNFAVVRGTVVKEEATQSVKSKITVKNMANGEIVGTYQAQDNGDYSMELPNGGKFIFTVETPGIPTQSDGVQIPVAYTLKPYKQVISYDKKILKIINYFDGNVSDENYSMMIDQIEKKAKLEVNENEPYNNSLIQDGAKNQNAGNNESNNLNSVSTTNPTVNGNETGQKNNTNKNVTNEQLLAIAKTDAKEASDEAAKLKQDAQDAFGLATQKTAESVAKQKEADEVIANANNITDIVKKNEELSKANELKEDAKIAASVANTATNMAKKLEVDAGMQQKEADLTNQYITQLETVIKNKNNKEALTKLEQIQKELDDLSKQKNQSSELFTSLKAESELKQQELANSEKKTNSISAEINAIKSESENLEKDLANESDKSIKENISAQIRELNNEIDLKNKELATNNQKIEALKNEVDAVNQELLMAAKILNESTEGIAVKSSENNVSGNTSAVPVNNQNASNTVSALSFEGISSKYKEQVNPSAIDKTNKEEIAKQNDILNTYNKEVTDLIALDKNELAKTKDADVRKKLNDEIKLLEKQKTENNQLIASNNTTIKQLESTAIVSNNNNETSKNNTNAISNENTNQNNNPVTNEITSSANNSNTNSNGNTITNDNNTSSNTNNVNEIVPDSNNNQAGNNNNTAGISNNTNAANNNGNENAITNNTATDNEVIKPINTKSSIDNSAFLNELSGLKNGLSANTNAAKDIFSYNNYKEPTSVGLKETASLKLEAASQNENNLNALIARTESNLKNATNGNATTLVNEAEQLSNKAFEQRKESATKTGAEKDELLKQAIENEKAATYKKLEAAVVQQKQNKTNFDNNAANLSELQKLTGEKTSNEISQANMLIDEAALNFKQAQKLRNEAESYPSGAAKLGGLGNAEEKENEALAKQQKALEVLSKVNPTYKVKTLNEEANPANAIANVNNEITKTTQSQVDAYTSLSKANQNELKLQADKLIKTPAYKSNKASQDLKATSDNLNNEAKALIAKAATVTTPAEKANLLLKANEKEIASVKALSQAFDVLNNNALATSSTEGGNNTNTNPNNAVSSSRIENNASNNPVSSGVVANNNNNPKNTVSSSVVENSNNNPNNNLNNTDSSSRIENNASNNPVSSGVVANNNNNPNNTANSGAVENNNNNPNNTASSNGVENNAVSSSVVENNANNNPNNTASSSRIENNNNPNNTVSSSVVENNNNNQSNSASITGNGVGDEASKLKLGLNNTNETNLANFNTYTNSEAIALKEKAIEKINTALNEDKQITTALENVNQLALNNTSGNTLNQESISSVLAEADKLNNDAFALRKEAATKTGPEKDSDLTKAKELETAAIGKKTEAANKQKQLNTAVYNANKQSLEELAVMAKGKNIAELSQAETQLNEANLFFKQANSLRTEADAYPNDAAKLGGYSNAEEKENQALAKQQALLDLYKKYFPDYQPKKANVQTDSPEAIAKLNETKNNLNNNNQQHIEGLTLLTQANEKEYKNRILNLPTTLNASQTTLKTKAQASYKKQQALVAQAGQTTDNNQKKNLLINANQYGQDAINTLNQITNPEAANISPLATNSGNSNPNNTAGSNVTENNNPNKPNNSASSSVVGNNNNSNPNNSVSSSVVGNNNSNPNNTVSSSGVENSNRTTTANTVKLKVEGLEIKNNNAYSAEKPIPIDEKLPDGLVFKVQIGAFKAPLPNNTFKGLSPVIAQTTPNGYIRYMAGDFQQYNSANAVKNDLRNLGYSDAFVVAYYNGVRINLSEATDKAKAAGQTVEPVANTSAGITVNSNVPKNTFAPSVNNTTNPSDAQPVEITNELEKMNGLLYTVQIGVYSKQVTRSQLYGLKPIYTEKLPNGLYRYTAGIYNQSGKLLEDKRKVIDLGVKDAFVSAYYNSKRIAYAEGQKLQEENNNLKMETENPIIFAGASPVTNTNSQPVNNPTVSTTDNNTIATPNVNAFSNGVTSGPAPTPENGVKADDAGISFKVQIGAYKNQVPNDVAAKFLNIKTWPVKNVVINGLFIYTIGNFSGISFAKTLKNEAVALGITDAYITVYKDGKKLYGAEAAQYLSQ